MKKLFLLPLSAALVGVVFAGEHPMEHPKAVSTDEAPAVTETKPHVHTDAAKAQTIKGTVVDVSCYLRMGAAGGKHKSCGTECAKAGMPLGILDGKTLYIAGAAKDAKSVNPMLTEFVDEQVEATGKVFERDGMHLIAIEKVARVKKG